MIIPITEVVNGKPQNIGWASVTDDGEVEFYLNPGFTMAEHVTDEMTDQLKKLARKKLGTDGLSVG